MEPHYLEDLRQIWALLKVSNLLIITLTILEYQELDNA